MNQVAKQGKRALVYVGTLLQWVVVAAVTGGVGGLVGSAFHIAVEKVTTLRLSQPCCIKRQSSKKPAPTT